MGGRGGGTAMLQPCSRLEPDCSSRKPQRRHRKPPQARALPLRWLLLSDSFTAVAAAPRERATIVAAGKGRALHPAPRQHLRPTPGPAPGTKLPSRTPTTIDPMIQAGSRRSSHDRLARGAAAPPAARPRCCSTQVVPAVLGPPHGATAGSHVPLPPVPTPPLLHRRRPLSSTTSYAMSGARQSCKERVGWQKGRVCRREERVGIFRAPSSSRSRNHLSGDEHRQQDVL
jgi:hypothetical protein